MLQEDYITAIIYWWNPCCKRIANYLDSVIEMHVDHSVIKQNNQTTEEYLTCLLEIKKDSLHLKRTFIPNAMTLSIENVSESILEKRFHIMTDSHKHQRISQKSLRICVSLIIIIFYLLSYTFVFESNKAFGGATTDENNTPVFTLTADNAYIVVNESGTYDIYLYGSYLETVEALEHYDASIPIFYNKEDIP